MNRIARTACRAAAAAAVLAMGTSALRASVFIESEPNDSKATANPVLLTGVGDTIVGNSQGSSTTVAGPTSADYFRVTTPAQPVAIYMNRLTITSDIVGHTGTIRGLGQTATNTTNSSGPGLPNPAAPDNTFQTSSTTSNPPRFNQWYSFGRPGSIAYRVTGATATTADYTSTFSQSVVTPVNLGTFNAGTIELTNTQLASTQDTEVFVYDSALTPLPGYTNDDFLDGTVTQTGGSTLNSRLVRAYTPGTYYVAISNFNTADNQLSPADEGTATGTYLDYDGAMANSSTTVLASIPFNLIDSAGSHPFTATKPGPFDIYWATFTVAVPEPTMMGLAAVAGAGVIARRRRR
jgi:hypothetical protein